MVRESYQEKLSRQFARYAAGMALVFFTVFTVILLIYTLGFNTYLNAKNNELLSHAFLESYQQYTDFLTSKDTQTLFLRHLNGEVSDNYISYWFNSFVLTTGLSSELILTDRENEIVYANVDGDGPNTHQQYFDQLVQQNLDKNDGVYITTYHLFRNTGKYVLSAPLFREDGFAAGAASIYIDGSGWESIMLQNQFDGVITDEEGWIIAASNRTLIDGVHRFQPDSGSTLYEGRQYWMARTYQPRCGVYIYTFVKNSGLTSYYAIALCALIVLVAALLLPGRTFARRIADLNSRSLATLHSELTAIQFGDGSHRVELHTGDEFETIADHINTMLDHLESLSSRNLELAQLNNQMERLQLEAQFDPHFLYNTLESIRYAIRLGDRDADFIILKLTSLLRYSIDAPEGMVSLRSDLLHLRDYLTIIQYRFQGRFHYNLDIPDSCLDHPCLRLCLQPIVENSVKYVLQRQQSLTVTIRAWEDEDFLYLEVVDDGAGMSQELLEEIRHLIAAKTAPHSTHHGLKNIARRLNLQFGAGSGMELDSVPGQGTRVLLRIAHMEEAS